MKMKGSSYFLLFLILVGIVILYSSYQIVAEYPWASMRRGGFLPLILGSLLVVCCLILLFGELRKKGTEKSQAVGLGGQQLKETTAVAGERRTELVTTAWLLGSMLLIYLIGFVLATLVWVFVYLKRYNVGWIKSIVISLVLAAFIYFGFVFVFGVDLYEGVLPIYGYLHLP